MSAAGRRAGRFAECYWEDFAVGETTELGIVEVTREEIVEFAQRYNPQPFHRDDAAPTKAHTERPGSRTAE